ncbi:MAG: hypothetical protein WD270_02000, partial [Acetobacterales bacterium]
MLMTTFSMTKTADNLTDQAARSAVAGAQVTVNGRTLAVGAASPLLHLLQDLDLDPARVAVEHNGTLLLSEAAFAARQLRSGDTLEVVGRLAGGGKPDHAGGGKPDHAGGGKPDHAGGGKPDHAGGGKPDHAGGG